MRYYLSHAHIEIASHVWTPGTSCGTPTVGWLTVAIAIANGNGKVKVIVDANAPTVGYHNIANANGNGKGDVDVNLLHPYRRMAHHCSC